MKKYDVVASNGKYIGKDGTEKTRWVNVGSIMENDKGLYMVMSRTFNPAGLPNPNNNETCFLSLFPAKDTQNRAPIDKGNAYVADDLSDDIPF
jgi:hypothetical protein